MYLNYFEDLILIVSWLGAAEIPVTSEPPLPWYQQNYETQRLAVILKTSPEIIHKTLLEISNEQ